MTKALFVFACLTSTGAFLACIILAALGCVAAVPAIPISGIIAGVLGVSSYAFE